MVVRTALAVISLLLSTRPCSEHPTHFFHLSWIKLGAVKWLAQGHTARKGQIGV